MPQGIEAVESTTPEEKTTIAPPTEAPTPAPRSLRTPAVSSSSTNDMIDFSVSNGKIWANGEEFHIKGVNWFGFEETDRMLHGIWGSISMEEGLDFLKEHDFNAVRVPFSVSTLLENPITELGRVHSNPELVGKTMLQVMGAFVARAAERNILVVFDAHRLRPESGIDDLWYDATTPLEDLLASWTMLADTFGDSWNVFAADLKNEPHGIAEWGTGDVAKDWAMGATIVGNHVLSKCPRWLIFVEGVQEFEGRNGWWGGVLQGVRDTPVVLTDKSKLVYSPHVYGPSVHMQPAFEASSNFPENLNEIWDTDFGFIPEETGVPIVLGEWGGFYNDLDRVWQDRLMHYINQHAIGFFYWCFNPESGDTGGLVKDDWKTPETEKLGVLSLATSTDVKTVRTHRK